MKLKDLSIGEYKEYILSLYPSNPVNNHWMFGSIFWSVKPLETEHRFPLKNKYMPKHDQPGLQTVVLGQMKQVFGNVGRQKIKDNALMGQYYSSNFGSFKLHIGLNTISDIDDSVIKGLSKLLIDRARSAKNMSFEFKMVMPDHIGSPRTARFEDHDQFTLYFDRYSSVAEMMDLCDEVNAYLQQHLPDNERPLGPKDSIGFNSFVTGRFDTNTLNEEYNVFKFYDEQLNLFFQRYKDQPEKLKDVPVCVFETVFNNILIDDSINDLQHETFDQKYGDYVQRQLDLIVKKPAKYIKYPELLSLKANPDLSEKYKGTSPQALVFSLLKKRITQLDNATHILSGSESEKLETLREMITKRDLSEAALTEEELLLIREEIVELCDEDFGLPEEEVSVLRQLLDRIIHLIDWFVALFRPSSKLSDNPSTMVTKDRQEELDNPPSSHPNPGS